ncbi:hypothetical protein H2248_002348 [Termitomyces sp. 'cryptogamus']|nr:hypothetical protein H2248_002348 [Termitomyces sp. 'cryptogamus']
MSSLSSPSLFLFSLPPASRLLTSTETTTSNEQLDDTRFNCDHKLERNHFNLLSVLSSHQRIHKPFYAHTPQKSNSPSTTTSAPPSRTPDPNIRSINFSYFKYSRFDPSPAYIAHRCSGPHHPHAPSRHRRNCVKYLFDGNFEPGQVVPTAPRTSDDGDDGMGGRLGTGVSGVVMSFQYVLEHERRQVMSTADLGMVADAGAGAAGVGAAYAMSQSQHGHGNGNGHGTYTPSPRLELGGRKRVRTEHWCVPQLEWLLRLCWGRGSSAASRVSSHGTALSNSVSGTRTASAIAKEREAFGGSVRGGMSLANHDSDGAGESGAGRNGAGAGRSPIVHRNGGRVVQEVHEEVAEEIPPTYDSIPANERR